MDDNFINHDFWSLWLIVFLSSLIKSWTQIINTFAIHYFKSMDIIDSIILGVIQGLTEFLPVSSSGHLELGKAILGDNSLPKESLLFTVVLHF